MKNLVSAVVIAIASLVPSLVTQKPADRPTAILNEYVQALGGAPALNAVTSRRTEGSFDNGRGLVTQFRIVEKAPKRRLVVIGDSAIGSLEGSGRGFDGTKGWDKNFVGTGSRDLAGDELIDAARDADLQRPLHMKAECAELTVEDGGPGRSLRCVRRNGRVVRWRFSTDGLLAKEIVDLAGGRGTLTVSSEDYRPVDGVKVPFVTRLELPAGLRIVYTATRIVHNTVVEDSVFARPWN